MAENRKAWLKSLARERGPVLPDESRLGHLRTRGAADAGVFTEDLAEALEVVPLHCGTGH